MFSGEQPAGKDHCCCSWVDSPGHGGSDDPVDWLTPPGMEHITHTGAPHLPIPYGGCHFGQSPQLFPLEVLAGWLGKGMQDRASPYSTVDCKLQIVQLKPDPDVFLAWADRASPSVPSLSLALSPWRQVPIWWFSSMFLYCWLCLEVTIHLSRTN